MINPRVLRLLKIIYKTLTKILLGITGFVVLYFICTWLFSSITVNSNYKAPENKNIQIYILSNGVHTDIVVPLYNEYKDWRLKANPLLTISKDTTLKLCGVWMGR